jgi:hypothetical protein
MAHFAEGKRTETRDNKANISYGEREAWYLNSIESKSMIAIFTTTSRSDAKGVTSALNGRPFKAEDVNKKLSQIDLYNKADIRANGLKNAKPVKSVYFGYSYALCKGTPDSPDSLGKLTLTSISFSYNGQPRALKEKYVFGYGNGQKDNPNYAYNASDRWGTFKPYHDSAYLNNNPNGLNNLDYPYTLSDKTKDSMYAGAWNLKKILLPSGGQMEVTYEADDYGYVQQRRACNMYNIYGLGSTPNYTNDNILYPLGIGGQDNMYVYIKIPKPLANTDPVKLKKEILSKYLDSLNQLAFKLQVIMPKGIEPLTVYSNAIDDYGLCPNSSSKDVIFVKLTPLDGKSPLAKSTIGYLIENLTGQAFPGYDAAGTSSLSDFFNLMVSMLGSITHAFTNAENQMRSAGSARTIVLANSFVRLDNPDRVKMGGGYRVRKVIVKDGWDKMTGQYGSTYGQEYDYTTTENINGVATTISSGVASYEPAIGSEENPYREILSFSNKLPLASAQYGSIEMPMLEALYPSPMVGYSKVTVRSIHRNGTHGDSTVRSAIGKQVTEFYTARDFPTYASYTPMNSMDYNKDPFFSFFNKEVINRRIISQGFLVETNDMHGKIKSQAAYSESDDKTPISSTTHYYKNTGKNGLNDKVDFVYNSKSGQVLQGNMGIDMELMTDVREFSIESRGTDVMMQVDLFFIFALVIPVPTVFPTRSYVENKYRAVTCTKLINYHGIEDSVIVMDKGSTITTKTIAYDAETGAAIVTQTANEFNDPIYNVNLPAWWAYSGEAPAVKNIGIQFNNVTLTDGRIMSGIPDGGLLESGDELYIVQQGSGSTCPAPTPNTAKLWVFDKNKNNTALTVPTVSRDILIMDSIGRPFSQTALTLRVIRSGRRNNLDLKMGAATAMKNPIQYIGSKRKLIIDSTVNIIAASAVAYKEKWQTDNDVIVKRLYYTPACAAAELDSIDCSANLEKKINPYTKGLIGNLKPWRSYTFYGARKDSLTTISTSIRKNGYIAGFSNYWNFDTTVNNMIPNLTNPKWVWNSELIRINGKGQELETRDALNRYTAAQYGYFKNLPVAMSQNARYGESFADGFEDYLYLESLNQTKPYTCSRNYIDLNGQYGTSIIPSNGTVNAHTGNYMLKVNNNTQAVYAIAVKPYDSAGYNYAYGKDTAKVLNNLGGNFSFTSTSGTYLQNPSYSFPTSSITETIYPGSPQHSFRVVSSTYLNITTAKTYNFTFGMTISYQTSGATVYANSLGVTIYDLNNNVMASKSVSTSSNVAPTNVSSSFSDSLCPGIYKLEAIASETYVPPLTYSSSSNLSYNFTCTNCGSPDYKDLTTQNGCVSTKPIAASDSMINPMFKLVPGKKMQFSAWVRETCDSMVCAKPTYLNNHVLIQFPGTTTVDTLYPRGPIIDGWQKIDSAFTVPANATTASLILSNDGASPIFYDDIRIHPFNANIKSYVYDTRTLRLIAELDENNYASYYDYDEEGQLIRAKKETIQGVKTIKETRNAKQTLITDLY